MNEPLYLDRARVAEIEPSEGDDRHRTRLSPFAVPEAMHCQFDKDGRIESFKFDYAGKEDLGVIERLDDLEDPRIDIQLGQYTHKIVWLGFDYPIESAKLKRVAARLRARARSNEMTAPAKRLGHLLTASMLDMMADGDLERISSHSVHAPLNWYVE